MQLFSSLGVELCGCPVARQQPPAPQRQQSGTAGSTQQQAEATFAIDSVLFAGGPVWSVDWCPLLGAAAADTPAAAAPAAAAGPLQTVETLAVASHPRTARRNPVNVAQQGPGVVQLWGVPSSAECSLIPGGLPKLLALLWHEGRLAWDVKWCPDPSHFIQTSSNNTAATITSSSTNSSCSQRGGGNVPLQGLLAAALANGDVVVWGVPTAGYLLQQQQQAGVKVLSLQLPYVWHMQSAAVGGSLSSCCSWLPSAPHDKLLVGYWDGNVVIWQLSVLGGPDGECGGGAQGDGVTAGGRRGGKGQVACAGCEEVAVGTSRVD